MDWSARQIPQMGVLSGKRGFCVLFSLLLSTFPSMFQMYHRVVQFDPLIARFQCKLYFLQ